MADTSDTPKSPERKRVKVVEVATIAGLPRRAEGKQQYLYIIEFAPIVKIGISNDPYKRAQTLRSSSAREAGRAAFAGPFDNARALEVALLALFQEKRIFDCEWIEASLSEVIHAAAALREPFPLKREEPNLDRLASAFFAAYEAGAEFPTELEVWCRFKTGDITLADELLERMSDEDAEWVTHRALARKIHIEFRQTLLSRNVDEVGYLECVDVIFRNLFDKDVSSLRKARGLLPDANVRNGLSQMELLEVALCEAYAKKRIEALDQHGNTECAECCFKTSKNLRHAKDEEKRQIEEERKRRGLDRDDEDAA